MYIDEGKAGPLGEIGSAVTAFAQAAADGQFAVNAHGGRPLVNAIDRLIDWIDGRQYDLQLLEQEPPLGTSNNAKVMRPYMQQVAIDEQGFLTQLRALSANLKLAKTAILAAMANYAAADEAGVRLLNESEDQ
ncbi:hypothetical protein [Actinokineospora pegani]|uniref:hypothetical protein n=1 Tax=Actinokineospora pegani TaxID=2654637 RepID=UPI0012EA3794|nr:hypothetical protein [Actinokineospora pegani]